jgi:hypothetical protein
MDKAHILEVLAAQDGSALLGVLSRAYDAMTPEQRWAVFATYAQDALPASAAGSPTADDVDGARLLAEIELFRQQSLARAYYAPFAMNSKNYRHIPAKTREWCTRMAGLLKDSCLLTDQGDHQHAVACFRALYQLVDAVDSGQEIIFAEEAGSWMIPSDRRRQVAAYLTSLAAMGTPEEFTAIALPLIRKDSRYAFSTQAYAAAIHAATEAQRAHLDAEVQRQKIRTGPDA